MRVPLGWVCIWLACISGSSAAPIEFATEILPIFAKHCATCHGAELAEGGLRLDSRAIALRGGDSGHPAIQPGNHQASRLWQVIAGMDPELTMPPSDSGPPLSDEEIQRITDWIDSGATWPDEFADYDPNNSARDHWAFRPIRRPPLPAIANEWQANPIDAFILHALQARQLSPNAPAPKPIWLRRLYLDLLGTIPTPHELQSFVADTTIDSRAKWVDRVLADPRYGERWGQHWLDVVRFADTDGFEVNTPRPNAWPYRDYVIQSLNRDKPYQQFIQEQLLGDQLGVDPATGFLVCAAALLPGQIGADELSKKIARQDQLDEIVSGTCSTLLGLTVGCARCHHHKFDPISQQDYYSVQAIFSGIHFGERDWTSEVYRREGPALEAEWQQLKTQLEQLGLLPPISSRENHEKFTARPARWIRFTILATNSLEPCLDEIEVFRAAAAAEPSGNSPDHVNVALASQGAKATSSGNSPDSEQHRLAHIHDGQFGNGRSWMSNETGKGWIQIELPQVEWIDEIVWQRDRNGQYTDRTATQYQIDVATEPDQWTTIGSSRIRLTDQPQPINDAMELLTTRLGDQLSASHKSQLAETLARYTDVVTRLTTIRKTLFGKVFAGQILAPEAIHVLRRGDVQQPQEEAPPRGFATFSALSFSSPNPSDPERRATFANWLTSPENPLAARVIVNRIWQHHFGIGIVDTPSDFGTKGSPPSHPELLDWLASEFLTHDGSIKHLHRLILLSNTYGQSDTIRADALQQDADNRLLWRFTSHRMEAEVLRDTLLTVSGEINWKAGGPGFDLFESRGGLNGFPPIESFGPDGLRRMVYAHKVRMERDAVFGAFDCPDAGQACPKRSRSTTALQALNLLNSPFTLTRAEQFAKRIEQEVGLDPDAQIDLAFQLALTRHPAEQERKILRDFITQYGLAALGRALFNTNEFVLIP